MSTSLCLRSGIVSVKWECTDRMTDIRAPEVSTQFVTFLCMTLFAVVKRKITGSIIHVFSYVRLILWPWLGKFTLVLKKHGYSMQNNSTVHTETFSVSALEEVSGKWPKCRGFWFSRYPDVNPCAYCLWETLIIEFMWAIFILCTNCQIMFEGKSTIT